MSPEPPEPASLVRIATPPASAGAGNADLELARAVLRRDRKAAAELVERFTGPVRAYVRSRLFPRTDLTDDFVQEVFVAAWQYLPSYQGTSPLGAWILGISRHKVEDHYRRRLREWAQWDDSAPEPADDGSPPMEDRIDRLRLGERMRQILASMPEHYATVLLWRYWEQRRAREIAESIGRTEKAVERMLARAREDFRRRWADAG